MRSRVKGSDHWRRSLPLLIYLSSANVWAGGGTLSEQEMNGLRKAIASAPRPVSSFTSVAETVQELKSDIPELGVLLQKLNELEQRLSRNNKEHGSVNTEAQAIQQSVFLQAQEILKKRVLPEHDRKQIESHRILLAKLDRLLQKVEAAAQEVAEDEAFKAAQEAKRDSVQNSSQEPEATQSLAPNPEQNPAKNPPEEPEQKSAENLALNPEQNPVLVLAQNSAQDEDSESPESLASAQQKPEMPDAGAPKPSLSERVFKSLARLGRFFRTQVMGPDPDEQRIPQQDESVAKVRVKAKGAKSNDSDGEAEDPSGEVSGANSNTPKNQHKIDYSSPPSPLADKPLPDLNEASPQPPKSFSHSPLGSPRTETPLNSDDESSDLSSLDENEIEDLLKSFFHLLTSEVLRDYESSDQQFSVLSKYETFCRHFRENYRQLDFVKPVRKNTSILANQLGVSQLQYNSLGELGHAFVSKTSRTKTNSSEFQKVRGLRYFDSLFFELAKFSPLTLEESSLHESIRTFLYLLEDKQTSSTDSELVETFQKQLSGPLSRRMIDERYLINPLQGLDVKTIAKDLRKNRLDALFNIGRLKPFLDLLSQTSQKRAFDKKHLGARVPINTAEPILEIARELDRMPYFHHDGAPPKVELLKFLSGDQLERVYLDEVIRPDIVLPMPRKMTVLLYDVSSSMSSRNKLVLRNYLMSAYVDQAYGEVMQGKVDHVIYAVPFDDQAHTPEKIESAGQAYEFFSRIMENGKADGGGTSITSALISVFEMIFSRQEGGGVLDRANILLITDGEDNIDFEKIKQAREKIDPNTETVLSSITLGERNSGLEDFILEQGQTKANSIGKLLHRHIPYAQVDALLNASSAIEGLEKDVGMERELENHFPLESWIKLSQKFTHLESVRTRSDHRSAFLAQMLQRQLQTPSLHEEDDSLEGYLDLILEVHNAGLSQNWTLGKKGEFLSTFLDRVAASFKMSREQLIRRISEEMKETLLKWLDGTLKQE
ncbi:MAG: hypothetical protein HYX41_00545 [Bdellovibrio sp.]|nr:hypothetical protein [Bdellovibrio sp.]